MAVDYHLILLLLIADGILGVKEASSEALLQLICPKLLPLGLSPWQRSGTSRLVVLHLVKTISDNRLIDGEWSNQRTT